jgi:hypothetical protein
MIQAVRQQLDQLGKACCESDTLHAQEKGRGVKLEASNAGNALKIKVDGCLITDSKKCDCLYFYQQSRTKRYAFLVELKGTHYADALEQLSISKRHPNYIALLDAVKPCKEIAVAIVAEKARTNRPKKEEWENANKLRLKIIALERDKTFDLSKLT